MIAVTAFIGSIFGAGGGAEASNAEFLSELQNHLGATKGRKAWEDAMLFDDPEAPTTITQPFDYGPTGGPVTGSVPIDEGSIVSLDPVSRSRRTRRRAVPRLSGPAVDRPDVPGRGSGTPQADVELPRGQPQTFGHGQHARGDGPAARLLLPRDRRADTPHRAWHRGAGCRGPRSGDVHADRTYDELRVEPHVGGQRRPRRVRRNAVQP